MDQILKLEHISKSFGGIHALKDVTLDLNQGEILAVVGENGAGKSTLMKIIVGVLQPDAGAIMFNGQPIRLKSVADASALGISIVFQEPNVFPQLSVLENMFFGVELKTGRGVCDWKAMYGQAAAALAKVEVPPSILDEEMGNLSIGTQQLILIARGINMQSKILILDEPTSILSQNESEKLFRIMQELKAQGISILYISHRISEILEQADRLVVLRDGVVTQSMNTADANEALLITAMSGREVNTSVYRPRSIDRAQPVLELRHLSLKRKYEDVSFRVYPGQVVGVYGLVGAGRSEIAWSIFGELHATSGEILFQGQPLHCKNPREAVAKKIFYLPEDRGTQGIFKFRNIRENMTAPFIDKISSSLGIINRKAEQQRVGEQIDSYKIKVASQEALITSLSGGNQQKVVFCRWLLEEPMLLILDEPTRGIDVATKAELHKYIMDLAERGVAILMISSDLPEVMAVSDEVITMKGGKITNIFDRSEMTEEKILRYSLGIGDEEKEAVRYESEY